MSRRGQRSGKGGEGEGGEGEQPGVAGSQSVPEQDSWENGDPREKARLPLCRLWENVREVITPQSPPQGPHRGTALQMHMDRLQ